MYPLLRFVFNRPAFLKKLVTEQTQTLNQTLQKNDDFIRSWTHDVGNLVGMMRAAIDLLRIDGKEAVDHNDTLELLKFGCQMLTDINNNIVAFKEKGVDLVISDIEVKSWLQSLVKAYQFVAAPKNIEITLTIDKDVPEIISSDQLKLSQVLTNLLLNAVKFSPKGKSISANAYGNESRLYLTVTDQGIGIPTDKLKDIFLPYVRLNKQLPGTGLGLYICKQITNALNGHLMVNSTEGKGTAFTVSIPLSAQHQESKLYQGNGSDINFART